MTVIIPLKVFKIVLKKKLYNIESNNFTKENDKLQKEVQKLQYNLLTKKILEELELERSKIKMLTELKNLIGAAALFC